MSQRKNTKTCQNQRNERGRKLFEIFRQGEHEVYIASVARWDTQVKGLVELERRCQDLMQEVRLPSERQEAFTGMVVSKRNMQKEAPKKFQEKVFEEFKELEEQRTKEAQELVQKKHLLTKWEGERERARMLQRLGGSRAIQHWNDARDIMSVESCSPSIACDMAEVCSESSRRCRTRRRPRQRVCGPQ